MSEEIKTRSEIVLIRANELGPIPDPYPSNKVDFPIPHGWIQWKGTEVCMDVRCACGEQMHLDAEFTYHIKCAYCGQVYEVGGHVKLYPLDFEPEGTIHLEKEQDWQR